MNKKSLPLIFVIRLKYDFLQQLFILLNSSQTKILRIYFSKPADSVLNKKKNHSIKLIIKIQSIIESTLNGKNKCNNFKLFDFSCLTEFEKKVLFILFDNVNFGDIITYKKLAELSGCSEGARAIGNVMAKNPFPIIFPCHRVIKSNGSFGNFQFSTLLKRQLLDYEKNQIFAD